MMKNVVFFFCTVILLTNCSSPNYPERHSNDPPELQRHFEGQDLLSLGHFYNNFVYVDTAQDPILKDGYFVYVFIAREDYVLIARDKSNDKMAIIDPSMNQNELEFYKFSTEDMPSKAWSVASGEVDVQRIEHGQSGKEWLYVDLNEYDDHVNYYFTLKEINTEPETGLEVITILVLNEQRSMFFYDSEGTEFAPVRCDAFWTPIEEMVYRKMRDEEVEKVIWDVMIENKKTSEN